MIGPQARAIVRAHVGCRVVHIDGVVERTVVGARAQIDQLLGQIEAVVDDGDHRGREAVAVGQRGIRPALHQRLRHIVVPVARREHQRREAACRVIAVLPLVDAVDVRLTVRLGAGFQQLVDDGDVTFGGGPHERGFLLIGIGDVRVGARFEQQLHRVDAPSARRGHERRFAVRMRGRDVAAGASPERLACRSGVMP